jgi:hypothetical protein
MECIQEIQQSRAIGWQWRGICVIAGQHGEIIQGQQLRRQRDGLPTGLQALDQRLERMGSGWFLCVECQHLVLPHGEAQGCRIHTSGQHRCHRRWIHAGWRAAGW